MLLRMLGLGRLPRVEQNGPTHRHCRNGAKGLLSVSTSILRFSGEFDSYSFTSNVDDAPEHSGTKSFGGYYLSPKNEGGRFTLTTSSRVFP